MADLIAVVYDSEARAEEVRNRILSMTKDYIIDIGDAVIATRAEPGRVKLNQLLNTTAAGAAGGSFWGLLVGVLFMNPLVGVAAGAATGALAGALSDVGVNDRFMKGLADDKVEVGESVLFLLVNRMTADKVMKELHGIGGRILQTSLDLTREDALRRALDGDVATEAAAAKAS
jgi:uncharacterized membrane protein